MLSVKPKKSADLWHIVKPLIRQIESPEGVLIIDDSISEKPSTDENDIICWHYDHCQGRYVRADTVVDEIFIATTEELFNEKIELVNNLNKDS